MVNIPEFHQTDLDYIAPVTPIEFNDKNNTIKIGGYTYSIHVTVDNKQLNLKDRKDPFHVIAAKVVAMVARHGLLDETLRKGEKVLINRKSLQLNGAEVLHEDPTPEKSTTGDCKQLFPYILSLKDEKDAQAKIPKPVQKDDDLEDSFDNFDSQSDEGLSPPASPQTPPGFTGPGPTPEGHRRQKSAPSPAQQPTKPPTSPGATHSPTPGANAAAAATPQKVDILAAELLDVKAKLEAAKREAEGLQDENARLTGLEQERAAAAQKELDAAIGAAGAAAQQSSQLELQIATMKLQLAQAAQAAHGKDQALAAAQQNNNALTHDAQTAKEATEQNQREMTRLKATLGELQAQLNAAKSSESKAQKDLSTLQKTSSTEQKNTERRKRATDIVIKYKDRKYTDLQASHNALLAAAESEKNKAQEVVAAAQRQISDLNAQLKEKEQAAQLAVAAAQRDGQQAKADAERAHAEAIAALKAQLEGTQEELSESLKRTIEAVAISRKAEQSYQQAVRENSELTANHKAAMEKATHDKNEAHAAVAKTHADLEDLRIQLRIAQAEAAKQIVAVEKEALRDRLQAMEDANKERAQAIEAITAQLNQTHEKLAAATQREQEAIEVVQGLEQQVQQAREQNEALTATFNQALKSTEKETELTRALNEMEHGEAIAVLKAELAQVQEQLASALQSAQAAEAAARRAQMETQEAQEQNELLTASHLGALAMTRNVRDAAHGNVEQLQQELLALRAQLTQANENTKVRPEDMKALQRQLGEAQRQMSQAIDKAQKAEQETLEAKKRADLYLSKRQRAAEENRLEVEAANRKKSEAHKQVEEISNECEALRERLRQKEQEMNAARVASEGTINALRDRIQDLEDNLELAKFTPPIDSRVAAPAAAARAVPDDEIVVHGGAAAAPLTIAQKVKVAVAAATVNVPLAMFAAGSLLGAGSMLPTAIDPNTFTGHF